MAEQNSYDFWTRYSNLCLKCKVCPLKSVIKHVKGTTLCCPVERIRSEHWQFLLSALSVDNSLSSVQFKSDLPSLEVQEELWKRRRRRKNESYPCPYGYSFHNISDICKYTARLLTVSQTLQTLILENLPITKDDALHLAEGLKSTSLKEFSLRCFSFSDEVIETVCKGLLDSNISLIDFSACNLSLDGLNSILNIILKHKARRDVQVFPETLRYRVPAFEKMMGLTRIILNGNNIGDKGISMICETISEDHWIQALDLQFCGITNDGAKTLLQHITATNTLQHVDLRLNEIAKPILDRISLKAGVNSFGKVMNFTHLPLWKPKSFSKAIPIRKLKTKVTKKHSVAKKVTRKDTKSFDHAFRISYAVIDSKEGSTKDAMVQTDAFDEVKHLKGRNKNLELRVLKEISLRDSLLNLSEKFQSDNSKLRHLNENLRRENMNLRQEIKRKASSDSTVLIDEETYSETKRVFEKLQSFFQVMKDKGFWDLLSEIGVTEYENTRLEAVPSESKICCVEKVNSPLDGSQNSGSVLKQRNCTCHNPSCISNQKAEKENASNMDHTQKVTEDRVQLNLDKAKASKVYKDIQETYTNCDFVRLIPSPPKLAHKYSLGNEQSGPKSVPATTPLSMKCALNSNSPNKFKQIKTRRDLYDAVKSEMAKLEGACQLHNRPLSPNKKSQSGENQTNVKDFFQSVSSQSAAAELLSSYQSQKTKYESTTSGVPRRSVNQSNSPSSAIETGVSLKRTSSVSHEWDEHINKKFPDCNIEPRATAAGTERSAQVNTGYSKTMCDKDLQKTSKGTSRKTTDSFPSSSVESRSWEIDHLEFSNEQQNEIKSTQTASVTDNLNQSYLESVSDASTDKDVKSLSESELYESVKSDSVSSKSSNKSLKAVSQSSDNPDVINPTKSDSDNSKCSNKSKAVSHSDGSKSEAVGESGDNPVQIPSSTILSPEVALSKSSSKSSKRSQKQKKNFNQNASGGDGKNQKDSVSGSSVPSLSDITTVSSHSLNTDSVMDQLSESEKGLS